MRIHINKKGKACCSGLPLWEGWEEIYDEERRVLYSELLEVDPWSPGWGTETFCRSCLCIYYLVSPQLKIMRKVKREVYCQCSSVYGLIAQNHISCNHGTMIQRELLKIEIKNCCVWVLNCA